MLVAAALPQPTVAASPAPSMVVAVGTNRRRDLISLFKPNYILPAYYTFAPDNSVYGGHTPSGEKIHHVEFAFQLSLKVTVLSGIAGYPVDLDTAYTQKSFWQAYNQSAFFRESDYEPELFLQWGLDHDLPWGWTWTDGGAGLVHQSNGKGGTLERSWNRVYFDLTLTNRRWQLVIKPWYIIHDGTYERQNPDMARYLGYGEWIVSYRWSGQEISLLSRNNITSGFSRGYWQVGWTFPLLPALKGYVQVSTGYGQSLIEYDHRTAGVGVGFALNNW